MLSYQHTDEFKYLLRIYIYQFIYFKPKQSGKNPR